MAPKATKLKYKLSEIIDQKLPRSITIADLEAELAKEGISKFTFYRDRYLTIKSRRDIPSARLDVYAALLGVTANELKNYTVKVKPITDRVSAHERERIKSITGLKTK